MSKFLNYINRLILLSLLLIAISCSDSDEDNVQPAPETLVDSERVGTRNLAAIQLIIDFSGEPALQQIRDSLSYDVEFYRVVYKTEYLGEEIEASGLVTFPVTNDELPILSYQNGTYTDNSNAPSVDTETSTLFSSLASAGYIFVVPDYIGFGESAGLVSPYHQKDFTATAVLDLIEASAELAAEIGYNFNSRFFLAGYSEGGYATMATHKMFEETVQDELELVASAPASGGYDVKAFQEYFFSLETYSDPYFMAYVALSYQYVYPELNLDLATLFQEPFASDIPALFDGTLDGAEINDALTTSISEFIQPDVLESFETDPKFENWRTALNDNNLTNWSPQNTMIMYHGDNDVTVPYQNSVTTYESFLAAGSTSSNLTFITLEGKNHGSGVIPFLGDALLKFEELK